MDDDLSFGTSVWSAPDDPIASIALTQTAFSATEDSFGDLDDFAIPAGPSATELDDDFGDFGDFGEAQIVQGGFVEEAAFEDARISAAGPSSTDWKSLRLDPLPSRDELQEEIYQILEPLWFNDDMSQLSDEDIRQVEGLNQTLVTPESRQLYSMLLPSNPPAVEPVNWTRSRIRRKHLIALGIPVNLDEVLPRTAGRLPMLEVHTRPMSAPPGPRSTQAQRGVASASGLNSRTGSRPGTPKISEGPSVASQARLLPKPALDEAKVSSLLNLNPDTLSLLPPAKLEAYLAELNEQTLSVSAVLTHLLQTRDALQQDAETYNKLIGELVGEAQKIKAQTKKTPSRRGTTGP